ncbi:MAG: peptidase M61, partial [Burkholderiaceae bacterium]|nr:peptidase M61 [Burkholderiaceae bacterium]
YSWVIHDSRGAIDIEIIVYAWDLSVRGAHIDQHHAFFNGTSVFLCVDGQSHLPCEVLLTVPAEFNHWQAYTSMPKQLKQTKLGHNLGHFYTPNYDALIDHPFELGTPQTIEFLACGASHQLVFTGHTPNLDLERIRRDVQRICEAQIKLFEPKSQRAPFLDCASVYSFLTLVTGDGYGGLEHRASTALLTARDSLPSLGQTEPPTGYSHFLGLVSHEYFHTWHVKRIKPQAFIPYDFTQANYTSLLWVFEGFTSYYDDLMLVRSGVMSEDVYFKRLGETIAGVLRQPGRFKQSVAQSSFEAWTKYYKQDENAPNAISSYYA